MDTIRKPRHWQVFLLALIMGAVIFVPFMIYDGGYFIYYGDFNVQQIPFYQLAHEAVRSGDFFWSWYTDLGANFVGSYSFYLLFSPFFWLTLPFPTAFLPHLMGPLLMLKTACAALTAYLFLERFVRDTRYAVIGGLLYAFSGWMDFNIFFNHFHEVAIFFPLLLLGVELLVQEDRKGFFAVAVALNAMVNYWFFVGEVVFVILYILVRRSDRSWRLTLGKFFRIALEAVLGVGCATVVLLPSVLALMGNPRTGTGELLNGWNIWLYWHEQRQPAIVQSLFFPPELPARPNFLPDHGAKWASLSGWLPFFAMTGVLAYFFQRQRDWLKKLLAFCLLFALIPGLNNLFILLNDSYYARWFYMPVLLMSMATIRALEDSGETTAHFARAVKWSGIILAGFTIMSGLTPLVDDGELHFGLANNPAVMWVFAAIAMVCLVLTGILMLRMRRNPRFLSLVLAGVMAVSCGFNLYYIANGKNARSRNQWLIDRGIHGRENVVLPEEPFARTDVYDSTDNIAMYWHLPNIQAFHSIVPASIMEFYPEVGVTRDVGSRPEAKIYALRPLLSVRWLFIEEDKGKQDPMPGYSYYGNQNNFNIYENDNYLPMGFAYDSYVTRSQMEDVEKDLRSNLMLRAVVMENQAANRNLDLLEPLDGDRLMGFTSAAMEEDVEARRQYTVDSFQIDTQGFTATSSFDTEQLVFFSVPYEKGWSARILLDGVEQPLWIEKVNLGFMAVRVPAGNAVIRFDYETPGLVLGAAISLGFVFILAGYWLLNRRKAQHREQPDLHHSLLEGQTINLSWEEYLKLYSDKGARSAHLQKVLNEAATRHKPDQLDQNDQTLHFSVAEEIAADNQEISGDTKEQHSGGDGPPDQWEG